MVAVLGRTNQFRQMMNRGLPTDNTSQSSVVTMPFKAIRLKYQIILDKSTPLTKERWVFAILLVLLFGLRILIAQGWYLITYAMAIYHLKLFMLFLTPKIDPSQEYENDGLDHR